MDDVTAVDSFEAITIQLPETGEMLVRRWGDGTVEVDLRVTGGFGPRVWTPISLLGGSFEVTYA